MTIRKGDTVVLVKGKDNKKEGKVLKVLGDKILVSGINVKKKHMKGVPSKNIAPAIIERESYVYISNFKKVNTDEVSK